MFGGQASPPGSDHASTTAFYLLSAFVALALPTTRDEVAPATAWMTVSPWISVPTIRVSIS